MALNKLAEDLNEVDRLGAQKDWKGLENHIDRTLRPLNLSDELRKPINELAKTGRQLNQLKKLEVQFATDTIIHLAGPEAAELPPSLRQALADLEDIGALETLLTGSWQKAPDESVLQKGVKAFRRLSNDPALTMQLQGSLASRAEQAGHRELARRLLPPGRPLEEFAPVRDMKAVGSAQKVGTSGGGTGSAAPGLGPAPEAPPGMRSGPKEAAGAGLPSLEKEVRVKTNQARQRVRDLIREQVEGQSHHVRTSLHQIDQIRRGVLHLGDNKDKEEDREEDVEAAVARAIHRPLTPSERILIKGMRAKGKKTSEMAAILRELEAPAK
jgi:hypothetical protein